MSTMALTFDTLQYAKKLQQAGFTEQQAEIQAETFKEQADLIYDWTDDNLATKRDLQDVETRLTIRINNVENRINEVEERLTNRMNEMSYKITIKLGSMIAGAVIILGVLMPIMLKFLGGH